MTERLSVADWERVSVRNINTPYVTITSIRRPRLFFWHFLSLKHKSETDKKKQVRFWVCQLLFVQNIARAKEEPCQEEELWEMFSKCTPQHTSFSLQAVGGFPKSEAFASIQNEVCFSSRALLGSFVVVWRDTWAHLGVNPQTNKMQDMYCNESHQSWRLSGETSLQFAAESKMICCRQQWKPL